MSNVWNWAKGLGIVISGAIAFSGNYAIATKIMDYKTLQKSTNNEQNELIESLNKAESSVTLKNDAISEDNSLNPQLSLESKQVCWIQNGQMVCSP